MNKILVVDDEKNHRLMIKLHLNDVGYDVDEAENGSEALSLILNNTYKAILLDLRMEIMDGLTLLSLIKKNHIGIPVIVITAFSSVKNAVTTMKLGAVDFLTKPIDIPVLLDLLEQIECSSGKKEEQEPTKKDFIFEGIYSARGLGKTIDLLKMVAPTDATVLIYGESGTGKELIAKSIHANSPRRCGPFIAINCGSINENLIENELFGHEKGAYTGANSSKQGKFELASQGTLFLDEITELPYPTQSTLLRAIQEKSVERVGGTKTIKADIRIVAATNKNLKKMVDENRFREDLFFRLNVFPVNIPPLRERKFEIPLLVEFFIGKFASQYNKLTKNCTEPFIKRLSEYDFPGNIRELENIIERCIIMSNSETMDLDLLPDLKQSIKTENHSAATLDVKENEKILIMEALNKAGGNKTLAAKILGISRKTMHNKIKEMESGEV